MPNLHPTLQPGRASAPVRWSKQNRGMTLVEVVTALAILAMTLTGILAIQLQSRRLTEGSVYQNTALTIVQGYLEQMKNMDLNSLINADTNGNAQLSSTYAIPTMYSDSVTDSLKTSTGTIPTISSLVGGTTPSGVQDNLKSFDMAKDIKIGTTEAMTNTDTSAGATTRQIAWTTLWPNARDYSNAISSGFSGTSTMTGVTDMHVNLWVWITDLSGTTTYATKTYGITIIYSWQFLDGNRTRYAVGTVRSVRSAVPSF
ncbi:MAG TPA: prepilin-type N-terminal cleavage/methylation domain-containing protein [Candidatus Didemnitutus sp.]|nr:prepilin-type N-terminal cleavage/methylation domain-containing protein [Candidatus Didemnitutus sp.]